MTCVCENGVVYPDGDRELHSNIPDPAHLPRGSLLSFVSGKSLWITPALCQLPATDIRGECYRTVLGQSSNYVCITLLVTTECHEGNYTKNYIAVVAGFRHHQINL